MDFTPRPYQLEALRSIWSSLKDRFTLFVGATGLGKLNILIVTIDRLLKVKPDIKICFLVNKIDLLEQTVRRVNNALPDKVCQYSGKIKESHASVVVASIQSIYNKDFHFDLIILDEAHNVDQEKGRYFDFVTQRPKARVLACTATPFREDGLIYGPGKWFTKPCFKRDLLWSIGNKFLVGYTCRNTKERFDTSKLKIKLGDFDKKDLSLLVDDSEKVLAQVEDAIPQLEEKKKVIWACVNIKHATAVYNVLRSIGEKASIVHSKFKEIERRKNLDFFEKGKARHLVFVSVVSEGYDHPPIDAVVLMRPTRSAKLYVQTCGRGLRPSVGKDSCLILDYGNVIESLGPLHDPVVNSSRSSKKGVITIRMKYCDNCYCYCELKETTCPDCGEKFKKKAPSLQNLERKSYRGEQRPRQFKVARVEISKHIGGSQMASAKIVYFDGGLGINKFQEFFFITAPWGANKFRSRLRSLGIRHVKPESIYNLKGTINIDCKAVLNIEKKGKYWSVI